MKKKLTIVAVIFFMLLACVFAAKPPNINPIENLYATSGGVITLSDKGEKLYFGSGTFLNNKENPYFGTCYHVIQDKSDTKKVLFGPHIVFKTAKVGNWESESVQAILVAYAPEVDFAILELKSLPSTAKCVIINDIPNYSIGDEIYYFGLPGRPSHNFLYYGRISNRDINVNGLHSDGMNVYPIQGNSGSTVFKNGKAIGIMNTALFGASQAGFIPYSDIKKRADGCGIVNIIKILNGTCVDKLSNLIKEPIKF